MSFGEGHGLTPEKIAESVRTRKLYGVETRHYESFRQAFVDAFIIRQSGWAALAFFVFLFTKQGLTLFLILLYAVQIAILYAIACAAVCSLYRIKFFTRHVIQALCMLALAALIFLVPVYQVALLTVLLD